ncbi:hypothetical protein HBF26_06520 [Luteibacter jiangsuensis]|uniref:ElaB/YqjD/DUF883 family membrane-anchored ribosome-binding protein n=1 Tax=Luteibacter jiangsuensis TaxID=637577 RepID=A0ABX0Q458_9GAMM|nr:MULTISPECIES: hypothetical protein [Luteibacter]NID04531.1 hypothetical protein [Luteibacter jiangsuensis]NII56077.1 hypothetical protein [Luteibacter sp. SG786]
MSRNREFARHVESAVNGVSGRVRHYADEAAGAGSDLLDRSRRITGKLARRANDQRIRYMAEDLADEATYQYRKLRRRVQRHPGVTIGIAAAAIGTFLLIRHALRDDD